MPTVSKGIVRGDCGPMILLGCGRDGEAARLSRCRRWGIICLGWIIAGAVARYRQIVDLVVVAERGGLEGGSSPKRE